MVKRQKVSQKIKIIQLCIAVVIILLILIAGAFFYNYFTSSKVGNFSIKNKYYSFELQTPKGWVGEEKALYSEDKISQLLAQCKGGELTNEIGAFKFKNQRYADNFGDSADLSANLPSGAVLEITVNCAPDNVKSGIGNYIPSSLEVAGEKAVTTFLNLPTFGKTEQISFLHNNLQYKISEDIYISSLDRINEEKLRGSYTAMFNKIISSFKFTK